VTAIGHHYILIGLEIGPGRQAPAVGGQRYLLDRTAAEQALTLAAGELSRIVPGIGQCALTMAGALYEQTQILRPGVPVYAALRELQRSASPGQGFAPRLLSVGASEGRMPHRGLQPDANTPPGALLVLPLLVSGQEDAIVDLSAAMEQLFLERGEVGEPPGTQLGSLFGLRPAHVRFMTLTDLNALLRLQLELFGFLPLWELLDTAINRPRQALTVSTAGNTEFEWREGAVHSFFQTFDRWATDGAGRNSPANAQELQTGYADWTREYRRYTTMLEAHGVTVEQHLADRGGAVLTGSFLREESPMPPGSADAPVTEHSVGDIGTVAVTVVRGGRQVNFYPLRASGLEELQDHIRAQGYAGHTALPGRLCVDETSRRLKADTR